MNKNNQSGLIHNTLLLGLSILVLSAVGFAGWHVYKTNNEMTAQAGGCTSISLQKGSRGSCVKNLQTMLNELYFSGLVVDGVFGSQTQAAVKNFQKNAGLTVDGVVGPKQSWPRLCKVHNIIRNGTSPYHVAAREAGC